MIFPLNVGKIFHQLAKYSIYRIFCILSARKKIQYWCNFQIVFFLCFWQNMLIKIFFLILFLNLIFVTVSLRCVFFSSSIKLPDCIDASNLQKAVTSYNHRHFYCFMSLTRAAAWETIHFMVCVGEGGAKKSSRVSLNSLNLLFHMRQLCSTASNLLIERLPQHVTYLEDKTA